MKRLTHLNKGLTISIPGYLAVIGLLFVIMFHPDFKTGKLSSEIQILCFIVVLSLAVFLAKIQFKIPYCVTEYDDRLIEKHITGEATTVLFKDIERIEYPYFREKGQDNTRSIRFVMKDGEDVLMYDSYFSMQKFLKRWQEISAGLDQKQEAGAANTYRPGAADFVMKPRLAAYPGFYLMCGAAALFLMAVGWIIAAPDFVFGYIVLPITVLWYHSQGLPLNSFRKEGDRLLAGNPWLLKKAVFFELEEVDYIAVQDVFVTIKLNDGTVFCFAHKLSQEQKEEFRGRINEMGLGNDAEGPRRKRRMSGRGAAPVFRDIPGAGAPHVRLHEEKDSRNTVGQY